MLSFASTTSADESIKDEYSIEGPQRPNLGVFLREFGGGESPQRRPTSAPKCVSPPILSGFGGEFLYLLELENQGLT